MESNKHQKRITRPRKKEVDYHESNAEAPAASRVPYEHHAQACLADKFGKLKPMVNPGDLTVEFLRSTGFQDPLLVRAEEGLSDTRKALGMCVPEGLSPGYIARALGPDVRVPTIDVESQTSGPRMTLAEWAQYYEAGEKERLLNVVSLSLAGTPLEDEVIPPAAVRGIDLVDAVWPAEEKPRPEVLLYALMSPAGCYTDFHVDFGGSSIWYHVVKGRKTFLLVPPTPQNMKSFEEWSSSDRQGGMFYADKAEGCIQATVNPGNTLLIPSSWPHAVVTQEDAIVVGGNFLHAFELRRAVECWEMESRLKVHASARFPLFEPLMWHTVAHYHQRLLSDDLATESRTVLTAWELTGMMCVLAFLKKQMDRAEYFYCPESIPDPVGLLQQTEQAASGLMPEGLLPDLFSDLNPLEPSFVSDIPEDLLLDDGPTLLDDLDEGVRLPLPDVTSPDWLDGIGNSSGNKGTAAGDASHAGKDEEAAPSNSNSASEEGESSGDEWTAGKRTRGGAAQHAKQQRLEKLKAAKAAREAPKRKAARAAARIPAVEGGPAQQAGPAEPHQPVITMKASARAVQAAREGTSGSKREDLKAQMLVLNLRSRIQKELGMQADILSGKLQLKDSGARLQEGISETAARLAQALSSLAQRGTAETLWPAQSFQSTSIRFIDADGQVQGPFSMELIKVLQSSGTVQEDTLVMAAAKGPSLLREVMQMYEHHKASPAARSPGSPVAAQSGRSGHHSLGNSSLNGQSNTASQKANASFFRPGYTVTTHSRRWQDSESNSSKSRGSRKEHSRQDGPSRSASSRAPLEDDAQRKIDQARARRATEQQRHEDALRLAYEDHRSKAAEAAAQSYRRKPSWAEQAAADLAQAELAGDGAYQGSWTFMGSSGQEMGPYIKSELLALYDSGKIDGKTMVYDEEDGVTIEMSALVANSRALSRRSPSPSLLALPEPSAQQPAQATVPGADRLYGSANRESIREQFYSALEGDEHLEPVAPQAMSPARTGMQSRSTGQYLPGLAPATELRKRTSEMRQQHMAKLQRLAGDRAAASSGASSGASPANNGTPPPPPPLVPDPMQADDLPQHASAHERFSNASQETRHTLGASGHAKPPPAPAWQQQRGNDASHTQLHASGDSRRQQQWHPGHSGQPRISTTGQRPTRWHSDNKAGAQLEPSEHSWSTGHSHALNNGWQASAHAQPTGAGNAGHVELPSGALLPGGLGGMLQGIMTSVNSNAGASPAHFQHVPPPGRMPWQPSSIPENPAASHMVAAGLPNTGNSTQGPYTESPYAQEYGQQPSQQGALGQPWYGR